MIIEFLSVDNNAAKSVNILAISLSVLIIILMARTKFISKTVSFHVATGLDYSSSLSQEKMIQQIFHYCIIHISNSALNSIARQLTKFIFALSKRAVKDSVFFFDSLLINDVFFDCKTIKIGS